MSGLQKAAILLIALGPEKSAQIFMERYYFNTPVRTIAERQGMQVSAVNVLLHRILPKKLFARFLTLYYGGRFR